MKLISVDLESPLPELPAPVVGRQWVLVRLHGHPMGVLQLEPRAYRGAEIGDLVLERLAPAIVHHLVADGIDAADIRALSADLRHVPKTCRRHQTSALMSVTVAVCTRSGASRLAGCLDSLVALAYPPQQLELLVIDNAPENEDTARLVRDRFPSVRYVREPRPGLDWARNRAIAEARSEIVAFTDDDVRVDAGWAAALTAVFAREPEAMAVTGLVLPDEIDTDAQRLFEEYGGFGRGFVRGYYRVDRARDESAAATHAGAGKFGTGANMAFRRTLFDSIGGFDPALDVGTPANGGGDLEMFYRVLAEGHMLVYEPAAFVRHLHRRTYAELRTQLANNGTGLYAYFVRSAAAYPRERARFVRFGLYWFWLWSIRRLLLSLTGRLQFPPDLVLAELRGSLTGPWRYRQARRHAQSIARTHAPATTSGIP